MQKTLNLSEMASRLGVTRERVRQLVKAGRIRPAPKLIPMSAKNHIYIFAAGARKVGEDGKPGRKPKTLDKAE